MRTAPPTAEDFGPAKRVIAGWVLWSCYVAGLLLPLILSVISGSSQSAHGGLYEIGKACALVGLYMICLQPLLAARFRVLDRPIGLDRLLRFHRNMGLFAATLLFLHPLLLAAGGAGYTILFSTQVPWPIWAGKLAVPLALAGAAAATMRSRLRISYERWRLVHRLTAILLVVLVISHASMVGSDFQQPELLAAATAAVFVFVAVVAWGRLRLRLLWQNPWIVTEVRPEAADVWTIGLSPTRREAQTMGHLPGQFMFLAIGREGGQAQDGNPFTISSSPTQRGMLCATIKAVGDFTRTVREVQPGDIAMVDAPYGRFSYLLHPDERELVFIAAGIGITPLRAMLRHMADTHADRRVTLIYQTKSEAEIVYADEFAAMAAAGARPALTVVHVLSRPSVAWRGESGHLDRVMLARLLGDDRHAVASKAFYLCGPRGFMAQVWSELRAMGANMRRVHWEDFSLGN